MIIILHGSDFKEITIDDSVSELKEALELFEKGAVWEYEVSHNILSIIVRNKYNQSIGSINLPT
jgi:frataxin-like iron-binding protein CyaY